MVKELKLKQTALGKVIRSLSTANDNSHDTNKITISNNQQEYIKHSQHQQHHRQPDSKQQDVKIDYDSIVQEAGRQTKIIISVKEKSGTP